MCLISLNLPTTAEIKNDKPRHHINSVRKYGKVHNIDMLNLMSENDQNTKNKRKEIRNDIELAINEAIIITYLSKLMFFIIGAFETKACIE
jgi:hypothetical protein